MSTFPIEDESILTLQTIQEELFKLNDSKDQITARIKELTGEVDSILLTHFYNLAQASDRLDLSPQSVLRSIRSKRYKGVNIGNKWYVNRAVINDEVEIKRRLERGV
tara:strand:+ start:995 stop:1315 length:321 start_codon:yes stop_codon:yes gene_type:complete